MSLNSHLLVFVCCGCYFPADLRSLLTALIGRISSANQAVERLESRTVNTISFQEILGHLKEIYKKNERNISALEERLTDYGYTAPGNAELRS